MRLIENLLTSVLQAVGAMANNGGLFKRNKRSAFNPKITLGFNFMPGM